MKKKNNFSALLLTILITFSAFLGGCSENNTVSANKNVDSKSKAEAQQQSKEQKTKEEQKEKEYEKKKNEESQKEEKKNKLSEFNLVEAKVKRVVDGDTIELENGKKVRLIGINTPESTTKHEPYGKEASNYTKSKLEGKTVYLEKDVSETDRYGRLLRYVWTDIPKNKTEGDIKSKMFNALLVLNGFAQQSTYPPDVKYQNYFGKYASEARKNNKGLWSIDPNGTTKGDNNKTVKAKSTNNNNSKSNIYSKKTNKKTNKRATTVSKKQAQSKPTSNYKKAQQTTKSNAVYITPKGKKYHRGGCRTIKGSCKKITRSEAKNKNYTPCKVCNP